MKSLEKWKFLLTARKVQVVRIGDGCQSIEFLGPVRMDSNCLMDDWNQKGWELPPTAKPIRIIQNGHAELGYVVHPKGVVVELKEDVKIHPVDTYGTEQTDKIINVTYEGTIGKLNSINILEKGIDLEPSMKKCMLFLGLGLLLGWTVISPMMTGLLS